MYSELKCKTNFSFLRGASDAREYIARAEDLGIPSVAITDSNGIYGLPRAFEALKHAPNVKLICGAEITIRDDQPVTLLARDRAAYGSLCRIITAAHLGKEKGAASLSLTALAEEVSTNPGSSGLVALPSLSEETNFEIILSLFPGRTYLPLGRFIDGLDKERTLIARAVAKRFGLPVVATNEPHYHIPERRPLQDCLTCIREGKTLATAGFALFGNDERYLKSPLQMKALFADYPEAISNTLQVAESCTFSLSELRYTYPKEFVPEGHTSQSYLEACVLDGARSTYRGLISEKVDHQIRHELSLIRKLNYADYFLTIYDIVRFARSRDIICQGRGSAANSLVCYVLGITSVDPIAGGLLFERFISEDRAEPPDIDVDFEHERREEVIQYIYQRYGRDRAAMVSAVRTYQRKSSFLEVSKAVGVEVGTMAADALERDFDAVAGGLKSKRSNVEALVKELEGFPRHLSIHSGGFVISNGPMTELVPIEPARMEDRTIVQFDKNDLETLGMMKVDILALGFLTCLNKVSKITSRNWRDIPHDDLKTYGMIQRAETEGTFQLESRAQKAMLVRSLPEKFYDLVVQVSLVRPGPGVGGMVHPYLRRREDARRGRPHRIPDPILERILGRTYGVPIFQEQVMRLAMERAGFTAGEADALRRSLGGWRSTVGVGAMGEKLYAGLLKEGVEKSYADELFGYFKGFSAYNFPESHGASFASIAYKSAYYKCHYPAEYLCAILNCEPFGFYSIDTLINEAKRNGVILRPIDPNRSGKDAKMNPDGTILMGLRQVRGIRELDIRNFEAEQRKRPFTGVKDFVLRNSFDQKVIENLALGDAFSCFGLDQRHSFWASLEFSAWFKKDDGRQGNLFAETDSLPQSKSVFAEMNLTEEISADYRHLGYSLRGNIMKGVRLENPDLPPYSSIEVKKIAKGKLVTFAGVVSVIQRPPTAKGVCFLTLEDESGSIDAVVRKEVYEEYQNVIRGSRFLIVNGNLQRIGTGVSILASSFEAFGAKKLRRPNVAGDHPRSLGPSSWN